MLTYSITDTKGLSLYEYIYQCIRDDIVDGKLDANEKLPSKRAFAKNHGISTVTVENAYGQLMAEGYIYSMPKKGFFVSAIEKQIKKAPFQPVSYEIPEETPSEEFIDFISSRTATESFPFATWSKIMRQTLSEQEDKLLSKPSVGGVWPLREAIAKHLYDFRGINVSPDQIIIGAGTEYLYGLIVQLLGRDKIYGLENPCSNKIRNIYHSLDVDTVSLQMDGEGILPEQDILKETDVIQISPSHHFPTGVVTSVGRRYSLLGWANESDDRYIIEDDFDSEFRLQGKPIPSLFSIDASEKVIYFNTFSKTLASTIRISYMVLPAHLLERFKEKLGFYSCTVSNFEQYTLAAFINDGCLERHINRMRIQYKTIRDQLINQIRQSWLSDYVSISQENAGLHFLLTIDTDMSDEQLKQKASDMGIAVSFLSDYYDKNEKHAYLSDKHVAVINYSGLDSNGIDLKL